MNKRDSGLPWLHSWRDSEGDNKKSWQVVFGLRLVSCTVNRAKNHDDTESDIWKSQEDMLRSFQGLSANKSLALRYHWLPNGSDQSGKLQLSLFGKVSGNNKKSACAEALAFCLDLHELLTGSLPDLHWEVMTDKLVFYRYWDALSWNKAHVAEIHRKVFTETLTRSKVVRPSLLRASQSRDDVESDDIAIRCVYPLQPQK